MNDQIYCLDLGSSLLLVNLNSLCFHEIEKTSFSPDAVRQIVADYLQDDRPYFERLTPVKQEITGISPVIAISFHCNYACEYCYQTPSRHIDNRLRPEDISGVYRFYEQFCDRYSLPLNFEGVSIIGGEPLLPENLDTLGAIANLWPDSPIMLTTNGTYLLEYSDFLLSRETVVRVSLDGTEQTHFSRRKTSDRTAYQRAIEGIRMLLQHGRSITVLSVFSPENIDDYPRFFDLLEDLGWLHTSKLHLAFLPEIGCGSDDISRKSILQNLEAFQSLRQRDSRAFYADARKLLPGFFALSGALHFAAQGQYDPYRCGCLFAPSYAFFPDGSVRACMSMKSNTSCIGRFLPDIVINETYMDRLRHRRVDELDACKACPVRVLCLGGCPATAEKAVGDAAAPYCGFWKEGHFLSYYESVMGYRR